MAQHLVVCRSPSAGLDVQDDTLTNEYYIYVGNPVNKLSAIQDYRQANTGLVYDQEFAYLDHTRLNLLWKIL